MAKEPMTGNADFVVSRQRFFRTMAAASTLPLVACGGGSALTTPLPNSPQTYGRTFTAQLNSVASIYPDPTTFALMQKVAASNTVTPAELEVCWSLLGGYGNMPNVPTAATQLSFPADHALHPDATIEWYYFTLSLPVAGGGVVSVICNFFRKALAPASLAPWATGLLGRSICSTSIGVTLELPGAPAAQYSWPVQTWFGNDPAVKFTASPLSWSLGKQSISGGANVFPLHIHLEDPGDASQGRPPVVIDVDSAATNPFFLQGINGFVGALGTIGWEYYSWPQQATTGTVTVGGTPYAVSNGLTWMDHQWGGGNPATSGPATPWNGWSWFEFQFQGNKSLTFSNTHGALPGGIDTPAQGFGTYVDSSANPVVSELFLSNLQIGSYTKSLATGVSIPSSWSAQLIAATPVPISLQVTPVANVKPQALWMGGLTEYAEAAATVTATGTIGGQAVSLTGVGYCESVGFEDPAAANARRISFLQS